MRVAVLAGAGIAVVALGVFLNGAGSEAPAAPVPVVVPAWPDWAQQLQADIDPLTELGTSDDALWAGLPTVDARAGGAIGDGIADDADALQAQLDSLSAGGTLLLDGGVFVQSRCLHIANAHVRLLGRSARLHASNADDMCISLDGEGTQLEGLELSAKTNERGEQLEQSRVVVRGRGTKVIGNQLRGSTSAAIMIFGAQDYAIVGNRVADTLSDGIHSTYGVSNGYVAHNVTDNTGDDGIAVVSYGNETQCSHVLIEDNEVSNVSWARGISVVGSADIVVRHNKVTGTGRAAGIIVTREESYKTHGVDHVIIADNTVSEVGKRFHRLDQTGQAAIDLNAVVAPTPELQVRNVLVAGNTIFDGRYDGIRMEGGVCQATLIGNHIRRMGENGIAVANPACTPTISLCAANDIDRTWGDPPACRVQ